MYIYYVTMPENKDRDTEAVKFSANVIGLLKSMVRTHNKNQKQSKVNFAQLKQVYLNSACSYSYAGYSKGEWALAKVNMFLRIMSGDKPYVETENKQESIGGVIFATKTIEIKEELDISASWIPSQEDFTKAKEDIKENKLYFNFENVEELYLEDYEPIKFKNY